MNFNCVIFVRGFALLTILNKQVIQFALEGERHRIAPRLVCTVPLEELQFEIAANGCRMETQISGLTFSSCCKCLLSQSRTADLPTQTMCVNTKRKTNCKVIRMVNALSLVNRCVQMKVCKHGCDITRSLIGYVLSDTRFDWLVGNMSAYQEHLFRSRSK